MVTAFAILAMFVKHVQQELGFLVVGSPCCKRTVLGIFPAATKLKYEQSVDIAQLDCIQARAGVQL